MAAKLRSGVGLRTSKNQKMKKRFWKTPPELMKQIQDEFGITDDVCPFPKPEDHDALNMEWGEMNFVNPPFRKADGDGFGPTAFVRKAIAEAKKGKGSVIIIPTQSYVNLLLEAGAELRSVGRVRWRECETDEPCTGPSPITMFILRPNNVLSPTPTIEGKNKDV